MPSKPGSIWLPNHGTGSTSASVFSNRAGDTLALIIDDAGPIDLERLPEMLEIRARTGGEKLRPGPRARTQALKKLIQAAKLPVEVRARLPLLFGGESS